MITENVGPLRLGSFTTRSLGTPAEEHDAAQREGEHSRRRRSAARTAAGPARAVARAPRRVARGARGGRARDRRRGSRSRRNHAAACPDRLGARRAYDPRSWRPAPGAPTCRLLDADAAGAPGRSRPTSLRARRRPGSGQACSPGTNPGTDALQARGDPTHARRTACGPAAPRGDDAGHAWTEDSATAHRRSQLAAPRPAAVVPLDWGRRRSAAGRVVLLR